MEKIALITDSTCGVPQEYIDKYNVNVLRLSIIYKDKEYIDGVDITPEEVYLRLDKEVPTTSMPSVQAVSDLFDNLVEEGYTHAVVLPISSGLSGTLNNIRMVAEQYEDKIKSFIFDTKSISMGSGILVVEAGKMISEGKSFNYICEMIPKLRSKTSIYFIVDTLEYLIKGGRIGKVAGSIGELLHLKPIITMDDEGKYTTFSKVRGTKKTLNKLVRLATEILDKGKGKVLIITGTMTEEAEKVKEIFEKHPNTTFLHVGTMTPVVGVHSGPRLLGIGVLEE